MSCKLPRCILLVGGCGAACLGAYFFFSFKDARLIGAALGLSIVYDTTRDTTGISHAFLDGATGQLFSGGIIRKFPAKHRIFSSASSDPLTEKKIGQGIGSKGGHNKSDQHCHCTKWSVLTTISQISEAIQRTLGLGDNFCTVVVLDRKTRLPFLKEAGGLRYGWSCSDAKQLHILTVAEQEEMAKTVAFIADVPWNHFGRKNIGYFYAIQHGAEVILDIDDDNELIMEGAEGLGPTLPLHSNPGDVYLSEVNMTTSALFNPYPLMGSTNPAAWPRGLPLTHVTDPATYNLGRTSSNIPWKRIAVIQSLANQDPDVDAIYRLTQRQQHFSFDPQAKAVALPTGMLAPYNAQASLHFPPAYWGLWLPITVPGRVSDIWRSYIVQRILWDSQHQVAFSAPFVNQIRNPHSFLKDMDAERDLYFKATALTGFLSKWESDLSTLPSRIEQLLVDLYERDYLGLDDVLAFQKWLQALSELGYKFPVLNRRDGRHRREGKKVETESKAATEEKR